MNIYLVQDILTYLGYGFAIVTLIIMITGYSRINLKVKVFSIFLITSIISDSMMIFFRQYDKVTDIVLNFYTLAELAAIGAFYSLLFFKTKYFKLIVITICSAVIVLSIMLINNKINYSVNQIATGTEALIFILLSGGYFYHMLNEMEFESPYSDPIFWINSGVLIYFSGAFFFFIFSDDKFQTMGIWILHHIVHIIFMILNVIGFWKAIRK